MNLLIIEAASLRTPLVFMKAQGGCSVHLNCIAGADLGKHGIVPGFVTSAPLPPTQRLFLGPFPTWNFNMKVCDLPHGPEVCPLTTPISFYLLLSHLTLPLFLLHQEAFFPLSTSYVLNFANRSSPSIEAHLRTGHRTGEMMKSQLISILLNVFPVECLQ